MQLHQELRKAVKVLAGLAVSLDDQLAGADGDLDALAGAKGLVLVNRQQEQLAKLARELRAGGGGRRKSK